jgi:hypothetical protein
VNVRLRHSILSVALLATALWLIPVGPVAATPIGNYSMELSIDGVPVGGMTQVIDPDTGGDTGYYHLDDVALDPDGTGPLPSIAFLDYWDSSYDVDPFVTNNFSVTNISAFTQTFDILVTLPIVPTGPLTSMTGSVGLTVTNTAAGGATVADTGVAIYQAGIDGVTVQTLLDPAYSLSCGPPFCSNTDSDGFVGVIGPGATSNISIRLRFTLSPGDSASGTSVFNIDAVPEPTTLLLLASGGGVWAHFGRRRA